MAYSWLGTRHESWWAGFDSPVRSDWRLEQRYFRRVLPCAWRWWLGAGALHARCCIDSRPVQHSLRKQPCGPQRKQAEMSAADHSWHSRKECRNQV